MKGFWNVLQHIKPISQCIFGCIKNIKEKPSGPHFLWFFKPDSLSAAQRPRAADCSDEPVMELSPSESRWRAQRL